MYGHDGWNAVQPFFLSFTAYSYCSIAVSTICRHSSQVVVFLHAVTRPKISGLPQLHGAKSCNRRPYLHLITILILWSVCSTSHISVVFYKILGSWPLTLKLLFSVAYKTQQLIRQIWTKRVLSVAKPQARNLHSVSCDQISWTIFNVPDLVSGTSSYKFDLLSTFHKLWNTSWLSFARPCHLQPYHLDPEMVHLSATVKLCANVGKDRDVTGATGHTADGFASFFNRKVHDIRADTAAALPPVITDTAPSSLSSFRPVTVSEVRRIIMSSPVKSCSLDPWPTFLIRDYVRWPSCTICNVYGQRFARSRSSARHPQTRHSVAASQKGWSRHGGHG